LTESGHVRGFGDDAILHGVELLGACGVNGQVEHLAQDVVGPVERDVYVVKDDREALRSVRR